MTTAESYGYIKPTGTDYINEGDDAISHNADVSAKLISFVEDLASEPGTRIENTIIDPKGLDPAATYTMIGGTLQPAPGPWGRAINNTGGFTSIAAKTSQLAAPDDRVPVTIGTKVAARIEMRAMSTQKLSATLNIFGSKWNGTSFGAETVVFTSGQLNIEPNATATFEALGTVPDTADITHIRFVFTFRRFGETYPVSGDFIYFRNAALYTSANAASVKPVPFIDGDSPNAYWLGDPNASRSVSAQPKTAAPGTAGASGLAHAVLLDDATYRAGGTKRAPGKTTVSYRVDHGLKNFNEKMRAKLEEHGHQYTLALNSRAWGNSENAGITPAIVNGWVEAGLASIANHGPSHADTSDEPTIFDYVVNTKAELEADIPACAPIDLYMPPGASGAGGYGGFIPTNTPAQYFGTYAGQLVLENYAFAAGNFPNTAYRVQDGRPRIGQAYFNMDTFTASEVMGRVNNAIAAGQGIQLMLHPSLIDTVSGDTTYITTAELHSVLDQIKALETAGTVVVMSAIDQLLADSTD